MDLRELRWPCGCCGQPTVLSPGGDGVTIDVRGSEGAGWASFAAHRSCLAGHLDPDFVGDRVRVNDVGRDQAAAPVRT